MTASFKQFIALKEALSDTDRKDRAVRKQLGLIVQQSITSAVNKVAWAEIDNAPQVSGFKRGTNVKGDLVCRATVKVEPDLIKSTTSWISRILRQAGIANADVAMNGVDVSVIIDRGHLAVMGVTNPMDKIREEALLGETHDVSKPITSKGSTKGMLPGHKAKIAADGDAAEEARLLKAISDAQDEEDDEEEVDPNETPQEKKEREEKKDDIFSEGYMPFNLAREEKKLDVSGLKIQGSVRSVPRAKILWKKKEDNGTFTERWMYLAQSIDDLVSIKRKILAGTDIPVNKTSSPDGSQGFVLEQFGDVVWLTINGINQ